MRGGRPVAAACAAVLLLAGPVALAAPRAAGSRLPGPAPGCPARAGVVAPGGTPWAQHALGFPSVWHLTRGQGVTVAVVDSGVDANPQFGSRVVLGPDLAANDRGAARNADCVGHGTSMASIIAAAPMAGVSFAGVAPAARILSIKISNTDTFPSLVTPRAIRDAVRLGAGVINLSLASPDDTAALRSAVAFALSRNVVVVAAAGNDVPAGGPGPYYPAAYPGVLSVGAVEPDGSLAGFSDTRTPVSVTAPGADITSAYPGVFPRSYGRAQNGTSFAAAFVSGVVALVRAYHPRLNQAQVVARIEATADGGTGPGTGHGLVDPVQAVTAVLPAAATPGTSSVALSGGATSGGRGHPLRAAIGRPQPSASDEGTMMVPVIAGSFGLMIVVATAVIAVAAARRRRSAATGPPGPG